MTFGWGVLVAVSQDAKLLRYWIAGDRGRGPGRARSHPAVHSQPNSKLPKPEKAPGQCAASSCKWLLPRSRVISRIGERHYRIVVLRSCWLRASHLRFGLKSLRRIPASIRGRRILPPGCRQACEGRRITVTAIASTGNRCRMNKASELQREYRRLAFPSAHPGTGS